MSLDWNISKCKPEVKQEPEVHLTDAMIWGTMTVCLRDITTRNAEEWHWRLHFLAATGRYIVNKGKHDYIPTRRTLPVSSG